MKIISFDVGIKNMAYCIFSVGTEYSIVDWNILNLLEREPEEIPTGKIQCGHSITKTTKKTAIVKTCAKTAKYKTVDNEPSSFFCEKHAKENQKYILPNNRFSSSKLKSMNLEELNQLSVKYSLPLCTTKKSAIENLDHYMKTHVFTSLTLPKKMANDTDLLTIGKNMMQQLDANPHMKDITHVIIENQISPIANRMKTIQGMLAQYFIMRIPNCKIEFISSANKLKAFLTKEKTEENTGEYKQHKRDSVHFTSQVLQQNKNISCWQSHFDSCKKKDDLADAFLQGIWYIHKK